MANFIRQTVDVEASLYSGQSFAWKRHGEWNEGVVKNRIFRVKQDGASFKAEGVRKKEANDYFRMGDDFEKVKAGLAGDKTLEKAIAAFPGLRLLRQDPWECALSFTCTPLNNVKRITLMLDTLRGELGEEITGTKKHAFPTACAVVDAGEEKLRGMGFGFRARFVFELAKAVEENGLDLNALRKKPYEDARSNLMQVHGVGGKVADCILLFSCNKLEAFPVDVWIDRVARKHYHVPGKGPEKTREYGMKKFGANAGYAQQFLYHAARNGKI